MINLTKINPILTALTLTFFLVRCMEYGGGGKSYDVTDNNVNQGPVPEIPEDINATDGVFNDKIAVTWNVSGNAEKYRIYRAEIETGLYYQIDEIDSPSVSVRDDTVVNYMDDSSTGLEPGNEYFYKVRAGNSNGYSDYSYSDSGSLKVDPPAAPASIVASDGFYDDRIKITWNSVQYAQKYYILRSETETGEYTVIGEEPGSSTSFDDINPALENGEVAWYTVKAWNSGGYSDYSVSDSGFVKMDPPAVPVSVAASDGLYEDRIKITWNSVQYAQKYYILRSWTETGEYTVIGEEPGSSISFDDINPELEKGEKAWYKVKAWNSGGYGDYSGSDSGFMKVYPPAAPDSIVASDGLYDDRIKITWNSVQYAQKYYILRSETETGEYTVIGEEPGSSTSFDDINPELENGEKAWYTVKGWNYGGFGEPGNADSGMLKLLPPAVPMNLAGTDGSYTDRITLTWTGVPVAFMYYIYRCYTEDGIYEEIGSVGGDIPPTSFDDTSGQNGANYWYKVRAWNTSGYSDYSNICTGSLKLQKPSVPKNFTATDGLHANRIVVSWDAVPGTILYLIYRSTSPNTGYGAIGNTTHPTAVYNDTDTNLAAGTLYYYMIRAYNSLGFGAYSAVDSGYLAGAAPNPPASVSASDGAYPDNIEITWNAVAGATKYYVYRAASENGTYTEIGTEDIGVTHHTDTDPSLVSGVQYWYKVKAWNSEVYSEFSNADSGYTMN